MKIKFKLKINKLKLIFKIKINENLKLDSHLIVNRSLAKAKKLQNLFIEVIFCLKKVKNEFSVDSIFLVDINYLVNLTSDCIVIDSPLISVFQEFITVTFALYIENFSKVIFRAILIK